MTTVNLEPSRTTLDWRDINVGDEVTPLEIPVTATVIVAGAIASRDFMPVHHDPEFAKKQGSPNMFMNILTTNGLCTRFLTDWAGPEAMVKKLAIRLGRAVVPQRSAAVHRHRHRQVRGRRRRGFRRGRVQGQQQPRRPRVGHRDAQPARRPGRRMSSLGGKAAIAGIGQTEFSKESGRSELQLACEAVKAAIDDAGLRPSDVDGMVTFTMDASDEIEIARNVGIGDLTFFTRVHHGGGAAAGTVVQAAMAVATGTADAVVCYRAFNERSGFRFGGATARADRRDTAVHGELRAVRAVDARGVGRAARPAVHVDLRRHQRGLRQDLGRRPRPRGAQSRRVVLRAADHARGPPELAMGHRTRAAAARLLPGERRRRRVGRHQRRTGTRPAAARPR